MTRQELQESFKMAMATLRAHTLRSSLTILGVVIGVTTVMVIASFIAGIRMQFEELIDSFGTRTLFIFRFEPGIRLGRVSPEERQRPPLTYEDALAIAQYCPSVEIAVPIIWPPPMNRPPVRYRDQELYTVEINGTLPQLERIATIHIAQGRFFTDWENAHRQPVCVIGSAIADKFFPYTNPIGKTIYIGGKEFTVIGVLEKRENIFAGSDSGENSRIYIPYETLKKMYPQLEDHLIMAQAAPGRMDQAIDEITELLRRRRNVPYDQPNNFGISTPDVIRRQFDQITFAIVVLMFAISSVGLLVGGIGVMNIMLVSVTERTREIGIRKAIGARRRDIAWQFLIEAMVLTGIGGILGVLVGWGLSEVVRAFLPTTMPLWAPVAGFTVSVGVGLFFGLWPAMKAARLDPVEALRYE
ncbi:Macrolide export ATP-binding/permease protein MacB [bacterium HR10]|nr:Macrolide export ATP-binding/permease protein MacB [bacterium HR10]